MLAAACFAFLFYALWINRSTLLNLKNPGAAAAYGALAAVAFAAIVFISAYAWKLTLQFLYGKRIYYRQVRGVYAKSNIAKYLPGNVMHFAGRNVLGGKFGFSQFDMALSTIIEVLTLLITAVGWSLVLAYSEFFRAVSASVQKVRNATGGFFPLAAAGVALLLAAAVFAVLFYARRKGLLRQLRKLFTLSFLKVFLELIGIYSVTMLLPGLTLVMIFAKVMGVAVSAHGAVIIVTGYLLSWAVGYIVPVSGGLGVREFVEYLILGTVCPEGATVVAVILLRVASILGDVLAFAGELGIERFRGKEEENA